MRSQWSRQLIAVLAASCLLATIPAVAQAKKKKPKRTERTVTLDYDGTQQIGVVTPVVRAGYAWSVVYQIQAKKKERYLSIETNDATGLPVYWALSYSADEPAGEMEVCGSTDEPIKISPRAILYLWMYRGTCRDGTPALGTTGEITATFSNLP